MLASEEVPHFLSLSMLKTIVLLNRYLETVTLFSRILKKQHLFEIFCNIINVFAVTFDQFHVSLLNKILNINY